MSPIDEEGFLAGEIREIVEEIRRRNSDWFALCEDLNRFAQSTMLNLVVHADNSREILGATLFIPVLSNFQGIYLLSERGMLAESQILLRSMMEAMFSLCAVSQDEQLHIDYILDDERQRMKFINKIRTVKKSSPTSKFHELPDDEMDRLANEIKTTLDTRQPRRLATEELAKIGKLHELYNTAYSYLSVCVHARVRALERYLGEHPDGSLELFKWGPSVEDTRGSLYTACGCLLNAIGCLARLFGLAIQPQYEEYAKRYNALKATVPS